MFYIDNNHTVQLLTWRLGKGGSEAGVVDERVGHQEKVGDNESNLIQITWRRMYQYSYMYINHNTVVSQAS